MAEPGSRRVRVLVVDDSALVRRIVSDVLARDPGIEVVGTASDASLARRKIDALRPDVITLDIEMPGMDGLTFLRLLMQQSPMPVIVMSSLTSQGSSKALEALQAGAVEVVGKPEGSFSAFSDDRLIDKVKAAAGARVRSRVLPAPATTPAPRPPVGVIPRPLTADRDLILLGASTGGTQALTTLLTALPPGLPGILIVQHIPAHFSKGFADRLNQLCAFPVREARHGDRVEPNLALVAPGGQHMVARWNGDHHAVLLNSGPLVQHQRPSVDVLFDSAVKTGGANSFLAALLTGMGADGAAGMAALRGAGSLTIAQNEETCVVFGMPKEAIKLGGAKLILPLEEIAPVITRHFSRRLRPAARPGAD